MKPLVSLVVVPRERFSSARESLESVYANTDVPFEMTYVDGRSPRSVRRYLQSVSAKYSFKLLRTERYLMPNQARNIGLAETDTRYVVFLDNDVIVSPGWLGPLVECAEQTGAWAVTPITCIGRPEEGLIHIAGGRMHLRDGIKGRRLEEEMLHLDERLSDVRGQLQREQCDLAEFHCMLVRRELFDRIGPFDEQVINTEDHIDFCMAMNQAGGMIYFEPQSCITHVPPWYRFTLSDLPYYLLRWNDEWARATVSHFNDKWRLEDEDEKRMTGWITPHRRVIIENIEKRFRFAAALQHVTHPAALLVERILEAVLTPFARRRAEVAHKRP